MIDHHHHIRRKLLDCQAASWKQLKRNFLIHAVTLTEGRKKVPLISVQNVLQWLEMQPTRDFLLHPRYGGFFLEKNYYIIFDWLLTRSDWRLIVIFSFYSSCPYFRNEVGGEIECSVALCRGGNNGAILRKENEVAPSTHTPSSARGFNLFSTPDTYWKNGYCPYEPNNGGGQFSLNVIERIDSGSHYYKKHFYGQGK